MTRLSISATGCSLVDTLYGAVSFDGQEFGAIRSRTDGDGGLRPGALVFADDLERFSGVPADEAVRRLAGGRPPDAVGIGGPAAVASINAAQLLHGEPVSVRLIGARSEDPTGRDLAGMLSRHPVDLSGYFIGEGGTPTTYVLSDPDYDAGNGERSFINRIGAGWNFLPRHLPSSFFGSDIAVFGATALLPRIHEDLTALLKRARGRGAVTVVMTVYDFLGERARPGRTWRLGREDDAYPFIDLLITDREEAMKLTGCGSAPDALEEFARRGAGAAVITQGADDFWLHGGRDPFIPRSIRSLPVSEAVRDELARFPEKRGDTTGCGDNFAGGVIASLALQCLSGGRHGLDLAEACAWGAACGGFACFTIGGVFSEEFAGQKRAIITGYRERYRSQTGH